MEYKIPSPQYENMKKIEVKTNFILKYVHERISFHYQWNICVLQMTWMENHITRSRSTVRAISTLISCWLYLNQQSKWSYCSVQIWNYLKWSHDLETSVGSWFNKTCCLNIGHLCLFRITKKESLTGQINKIRSRRILLYVQFLGSTVLSCHIFLLQFVAV